LIEIFFSKGIVRAMTALQHPNTETDYVDLRTILRSMIEKKWVILATSLLVFSFAIIYILFKPMKYQASVLLQVQQKQHNSLGTLPKSNQQMTVENTLDEPISVQIALIRSKFILGPVIHSLGLDINASPSKYTYLYELFKKKKYEIHISVLNLSAKYQKRKLHLIIDSHNHYRLYNANNELLIQASVGELATHSNSIAIMVDKLNAPTGTDFTIIKKPETEILQYLLANLSIIDLSNSSENNSNKIGILQLSFTGDNPELITKILNEIAIVTQQKSIERKSLQAEKTLTFLNQQLPIVKKSLEETETKLNQYRSTTGKIDIKLQTHYLMSHLSDIDKQLQELYLKKSNLLQEYTSNYPFVQSVNDKINQLEKQRTEIYRALKKLPVADQVATTLNRDINDKNNLYMALLNQIHELQVVKAGIISDIHILLLATTPDMPIPVKRSIIGISSLLIGLMLGCLLVLIWKIFSRRIDDPNWIEKIWNIKNHAVIPYSRVQAFHSSSDSTRTTLLPLLTHHSPNDMALESLCHLRTYLQLNHTSSHNNIITIMSLTNDVGKTFVSANLASLMARIGLKVLLIDGNIRNGHLHRYFTTSSMPGLTDILRGETTTEKALIQSREFEHLYFLPSGKVHEKPADLLASQQFKSLLAKLSNEYQFILINSAPGIFTSDSILIGSQAGINLLVLGANMHEVSDVNVAIKYLNQIGLRLHGSIFNNIKPNKAQKKRNPSLRLLMK
jgi:tyrosine-protein kinase Etk/Wzc